MELPFEILQSIFSNLDTVHLLVVITVCRSWYRPAYETLYTSVDIRSERTFRAFLYTIAHHDLKVGQYVKRLNLVPEDKSDYNSERTITFTEFEILARHCPALESLYFHDARYWIFLNLLDWETTLRHLRKVPAANYGQASFRVYCHLGDRVSHLEVGAFLQHSDLSTMLSQLTRLKVLTLNRYTLDPIDKNVLNTIHTKSTQLEHLMLKSRLEELNPEMVIAPPASLKSLSCYIYSPESPWFRLIQSHYSSVSSLSLFILYEEQYVQRRTYTILSDIFEGVFRPPAPQDHSVDYIEPLMEMYLHTQIPRIDILFHAFQSIAQLDRLMSRLRGSSLSLEFTYYDHYKQGVTQRNLFISTAKSETSQHHAIQYHTPMRPQQDEIQIFHHMSSTAFITELILLRNVVPDDDRPKVHLDELLHAFPRLQKLAVGSDMESGVTYSISSLVFTKKTHVHLKVLTFTFTRIHPSVFTFVFKNCPQLQEINIVDCEMDKETMLALDYFCMKEGIRLYL